MLCVLLYVPAVDVQAELPSIEQLVTLSPVPNFRAWLMSRLAYEASLGAAAPAGSVHASTNAGAGAGAGAGVGAAASTSSRTSAGASTSAAAALLTPGSVGSTASSTGLNAVQPLLSEQDGAALLQATWSLSAEQHNALLAEAQLQQVPGSSQSVQASQADVAAPSTLSTPSTLVLQPWQRSRLLSVWLHKDLWRQCDAQGADGQLFRRLLTRLAARCGRLPTCLPVCMCTVYMCILTWLLCLVQWQRCDTAPTARVTRLSCCYSRCRACLLCTLLTAGPRVLVIRSKHPIPTYEVTLSRSTPLQHRS